MIDPTTQGILAQIDKNSTLTKNSFYKSVSGRGYFANVVELDKTIHIATSTDGVGSKIDHLIRHMMYDAIGKDCVAMNLNDLLCVGANPVGFQNHITTQPDQAHIIPEVVSGIADYCVEGWTLLTGGETEILQETKFHISGSAFGHVVQLIDGSNVAPGDVIIGLASSGLHANGWTAMSIGAPSLITKENLTPTKLYSADIHPLRGRVEPTAIVNITGGGFRNLERVPKNVTYNIEHTVTQEIFQKLEDRWSHRDLYTNFNMGIGMMVIVKPDDVDVALEVMRDAVVLGTVTESDNPKVLVNGKEIYSGTVESYKKAVKKFYEEDSPINLTDN